MVRSVIVGVIGAGCASEAGYAAAREVGRLLAGRGATLVCGGLGGVMEAACRGCSEAGGMAVGLLPGATAESANPWVGLPIVTNMGHARNVIIAQTAQVLIAVEGEYGTLSEIAVALKLGKPVISLQSWPEVPGIVPADSPEQAVAAAFSLLEQKR
ncbi:TIGR00725 family protein [Trichloromonas sp.]|uniref:TIGR00725 family protein n=1 Tax=Trichloromonas sp. TaxID=3069249 RepID=UPI003D818A18